MERARETKFSPIELFLVELRATGSLSLQAWEDLRDRLSEYRPVTDPAPGMEFVATEDLPSEHAEVARKGMQAVYDKTAARELELAISPTIPDERIDRANLWLSKMQQKLQELRQLGCWLEVELETTDE
jgi:hypothetical protein